MSSGAIFITIVVAMFPGIIIIAMVVKFWEVYKAKSWLPVKGKVLKSKVQSHKNQPGDMGYNFSDTEVRNDPLVEYEYVVANQKYRCSRITIGERTSEFELEGILARYPAGAEVTVFYNPKDPKQAVLERDLPMGIMLAGGGCLLLFFIGGPLIAAFIYFNGVGWLEKHLANPARAPMVAALTGFGLVATLFASAFQKMVRDAARWPTVKGTIIANDVESFRQLSADSDGIGRQRTFYKPSILYRYIVNGHEFQGDRVTMGVVISATLPGVANRLARRYPVGTEVDVHYNPTSPGESVLRPRSMTHYLLWIVVIGIFVLTWAIATNRI